MDNIDRLAKKIADMHLANRNPPSTAPRVGTVVSEAPLKIQYGDNIILESRHLIIADHVVISFGDKVIIAPDSDLKIWYVMGKVR
jgi:acetyltransferase-like isoleucine patch superfamily enzyme